MIGWSRRFYQREMFSPTLLGVLINPFFIARRRLVSGIALRRHYLHGRLLDFGCGSKPYKELLAVQEYIGVDIERTDHVNENSKVDVYYDGRKLPFPDAHFDSLFSSQVFEHLFNLEVILTELHRVLKPGGHMLATLPFIWDEHETPHDFARYTSFGIQHLLEKNGFEVVSVGKSSNYIETVFQMWNAYVSQVVFPANRVVRFLLTPVFIAPVTILGLMLSRLLPASRNFYLDTIVVARKPLRHV